jgi:hypothetical protein
VLRGGSWNNNAINARAAYRNNNRPDNTNNNIGFRLALLAADDSAWPGQHTRTCSSNGAMTSAAPKLNQRGPIPAEVRGGVRDATTASDIQKQARVGPQPA